MCGDGCAPRVKEERVGIFVFDVTEGIFSMGGFFLSQDVFFMDFCCRIYEEGIAVGVERALLLHVDVG